MKAVDKVWYQGFYRKNYLFFFAVVVIFGFIARPPTIFFSRYFIQPMLAQPSFFWGVMAGLSLYYAKALADSWATLHHPQHRFLDLLGVLPSPQLYALIVKQLLLILAPAMGYMGLIAGHALTQGTWHWVPIVGGNFVVCSAAAFFFVRVIRSPRERTIRSDWQTQLGKRLTNSLGYISWLGLWQRYRLQVLILKGVALILLFGLSVPDDWNDKTMYLSFWSIICLQGLLLYRLRQAEDRSLSLLRNLPIPRWRRWITYLGLTTWMFLPDGLMWVMGTGKVLWGLELMLASVGAGLLGIASLYYKPMELATYLNHVIGLYFSGFVVLLFGLPLGIWGLGCIAFSFWIFWEEYYQWNGWEKE